jgi:hypothetical protein
VSKGDRWKGVAGKDLLNVPHEEQGDEAIQLEGHELLSGLLRYARNDDFSPQSDVGYIKGEQERTFSKRRSNLTVIPSWHVRLHFEQNGGARVYEGDGSVEGTVPCLHAVPLSRTLCFWKAR